MLILTCPYCGVACDETELSPGGEAHLTRFGPGSSDEEFEDYPVSYTHLRAHETYITISYAGLGM